MPLTDSQNYDLVVEMDGKLQRVQVKTSTHKHKGKYYVVSMTTKGGNRSGIGKIKRFSADDVDLVFVVVGDGTMYLIPSGVVRQCLRLHDEFDKFRVR